MNELPSLDRTTTFGLGSIFLFASLVLYGDATISAFGYDIANWLTTELFALGEEGEIQVTYAHAMSVLSIAGAYIGNNADMSEFSDHQTYLGMAVIASVALPLISGEISGIINATDNRAMAFVAAQFVAFVAMVEQADKASMGWA